MDTQTLIDTLLLPSSESRKARILKIRELHNQQQNFVALQKDSEFFKQFEGMLQSNELEVFKNFLSKENIPLNAVLEPYGESLLLMALNTHAFNITQYLIDNSCLLDYISSSSYHYQTALQFAITTEQYQFIQPLLNKKVSVNFLDELNTHILSHIFRNSHQEQALVFTQSVLNAGFDTRLLNIIDRFNTRPFLMNCLDKYEPDFGPEYNAPVIALPTLVFQHSSKDNLSEIQEMLQKERDGYSAHYYNKATVLLELIQPILEKKLLEQHIEEKADTVIRTHKI